MKKHLPNFGRQKRNCVGNMDPTFIAKSCSSVGLGLDIVGAWIVGADIVRAFRGARYEHEREYSFEEIASQGIGKFIDGGYPEETQEYQVWQRTLGGIRRRGLFVLTAGFLLQLISNWIPELLALL